MTTPIFAVPSDMPFHPLAEMFPAPRPEERAALVADIRANGVRTPVQVWNGAILDGRNRVLACRELDMQCPGVELSCAEEELLPRVLSLNLARRHLTSSQRAALAVKSGLVASAKVDGKLSAQARDELARQFGTNPSYISDADRLSRVDETWLCKILQGEVPIHEVVKTLPARRSKRSSTSADGVSGKSVPETSATTGDDAIGRQANQETASELSASPSPSTTERTPTEDGEGEDDHHVDAVVDTHEVIVSEPTPNVEPGNFDQLGNVVPPKLVAVFDERDKFNELYLRLLAIRRDAEALSEAPAGAHMRPAWPNLRVDITNFMKSILHHRPHCVCVCRGRGCKECRRHGFVTEGVFKNIPKELRDEHRPKVA